MSNNNVADQTITTSNEEVRDAMRKYWEQHSVKNTVEEMMLDDSAEIIDRLERPEILALLPDYTDKSVLELGAGIGRFSSPLAEKAASVLAVDFMQSNVDTNIRQNGHNKSLKVICEDVTKLSCADEEFDLVFSNWLLMYLADEEVVSLAARTLRWLKPEGYLFFRESCFHQSGNMKRPGGNPSMYRSPQHYQRIFGRAADGPYRYRMILAKTVDTYAQIKGNRNQICWLWQKVRVDSAEESASSATQEFLDKQQYDVNGILRYEKIFGSGFVSTGGLDTTEPFVASLNLQPGEHVIDVGSGIGGGAFYMAEKYKVRVLGLDLSTNMVGIALDRSINAKLDVTFEIADATQVLFPDGVFDVVYSRDTILHIEDKGALFKRFFRWLRPGGRLLISDYCRGEDSEQHRLSEEFKAYVAQRNYHLLTIPEYAQLIEEAGFANVVGADKTDLFLECLHKELTRMADPVLREDFLGQFTAEDLQYLEDGWKAKVRRVHDGDQKWGLFTAVKQ
eukprot:c8396_g1_i1.p1 GENE.c8396_g1_i1~~c8396_g1_i1.p1  ORF type:complete len:507 (-),score=114.77 c8396_g1_i1:23-1543(-)